MVRRFIAAIVLMLFVPAPAAAGSDPAQPLGKPRRIDFWTTEGTIQSVDASPDGRYLLFDLLAHIYRLPVSGGKAEPLTGDSGVALNYDARYSPDGRQIVFVSDRNGTQSLWIIDADGRHARLLFDGGDAPVSQPAWAPDGRSIYFVRAYLPSFGIDTWAISQQIWRVTLDGRAEKVVGGASSFLQSPSLGRDPQSLYYGTAVPPRDADGYTSMSDGYHVERLDLASGRQTAVTEIEGRHKYWETPFYALAPMISPDGRMLAYAKRVPFVEAAYAGKKTMRVTGLWLRDLHTGIETRLLDKIDADRAEAAGNNWERIASGMAWSADSRTLYLPVGGQIERVDVASRAHAAVPFRVHVQRVLSQRAAPRRPLPDRFYSGYIGRPTLSPDGSTLVFEAAGRLWRQQGAGGRPSPLIDDHGRTAQHSAAWSPDGSQLAFATWDVDSGGAVWAMKVADGTLRRISQDSGEYLNLAWSADGRSIVAARGSGALVRGLPLDTTAHYAIVLLDATTGTERRLAEIAPIANIAPRPAVTRDGRITFVEQVRPSTYAGLGSDTAAFQPTNALRSMREDGSDLRTEVYFPFAADATLAPDGTYVAFREARNILVAPLTRTADGAPPFLNREAPDSPLKWVTHTVGMYPRWRDAHTLELASADLYVRYDVATDRRTDWHVRLPLDRAHASGTLALVGGRLVTMGPEGVIERGDVVIRDGRIACVGRCASVTGAQIVDVTGKTLIPGLLDVHSHPVYDSEIIPSATPYVSAYLAYGVTTLLDPASTEAAFPTAEAIESGRIVGPRLFAAGPEIRPWDDYRPLRSLQDARDEIGGLRALGALIGKDYLQRRRVQRQWLSQAVRDTGDIGLTAEGGSLYYDLSLVFDGHSGVEHAFVETPLYSDVTRFLAMAGTNYTPALQAPPSGLFASEYWRGRADLYHDAKYRLMLPWRDVARQRYYTERPLEEYTFPASVSAIRDILEKGGSVSVGAHRREHGIGVHWEIWTFATGMPPLMALRSATILPATYLGFGGDVGSLEKGKLGDLVILDANPLDDIRNTLRIARIVKGGTVYDDKLNEVWPANVSYGRRRWTEDGVSPAH